MAGRPVRRDEMPAHRPHDKHTKTNAVADMLSSGAIWAPPNRRWAQEVVEEMASFPCGEFDDLHDAAVLGLLRLRRGGFRIATDVQEEEWRRGRRGNTTRVSGAAASKTIFQLSGMASRAGIHFFFSNSVQFSTSVKGGEDFSSTGTAAMMRWPSAETSYR